MFEINLVPDVKAQMLKAQRVRNLIFIVCVMIMIGFGVVVSILWGTKGVKDITMKNQDELLALMSSKISGFSELNDFLTIQNQLNSLAEIDENRIEPARLFNIIDILKPTNGDILTYSEMNFNLAANTVSFTAQADAVVDDIDYRVLEAFKKSLPQMRFDYGYYVNENNVQIPSVCILETDENGNMLKDDESGNFYAIWTKSVDGCDPESEGKLVERESDVDEDGDGENDIIEEMVKTEVVNIKEEDVQSARYNSIIDPLEKIKEKNSGQKSSIKKNNEDEDGDEDEDMNIKIWRTPQFADMYENKLIDANGNISGIVHFESQCIEYSLKDGSASSAGRWTTSNKCNLVTEDLNISSSSNARDSDSLSLVLKFDAILTYNREALLAKNKHILYIAPSGYTNVTDSVLQIESLFKEEAMNCTEEDVDCLKKDSEE